VVSKVYLTTYPEFMILRQVL